MRNRRPLRPVLLAATLLLGFAAMSLQAFTPTEVACEESQLERLVLRFSSEGLTDNLFLWRFGEVNFSGLVVPNPFHEIASQVFVRDEEQITFDFLLHEREGMLNPRRQALPQAVLVRKDVSTNVVSPFPGVVDTVSFELATEVVDPTAPTQGISITNRLGAPTGAATGAARSLAEEGFFNRCSTEQPSALDRQIFEILSRTVRVTDLLLVRGPGPGIDRYKTVFLREDKPLTYLASLYMYRVACDENDHCGYGQARIALEFEMRVDAQGKLAGGTARVLPLCETAGQLACTEALNPGIVVVITPPIWAGHEQQTEAEFSRGARLTYEFEGSPNNVFSAEVPWAEILRGTAWDRPLPVGGEAP